MSEKHDVKKALDCYRATRGRFRVLEVPDLRYLMVDGHGDPNTSEAFAEAVGTLQPLSWTLKFASRNELGRDYVVPPLEGLWHAPDLTAFTTARDKSAWDWTLMMLVPDWVEDALVDAARDRVREAGTAARLDDVRLEPLAEGLSVQTLHVGSFDDEGPVLARLHDEVLPAEGLEPCGTHHEIYLSDVRRVAPEKLRTILRQPVTRVGALGG